MMMMTMIMIMILRVIHQLCESCAIILGASLSIIACNQLYSASQSFTHSSSDFLQSVRGPADCAAQSEERFQPASRVYPHLIAACWQSNELTLAGNESQYGRKRECVCNRNCN